MEERFSVGKEAVKSMVVLIWVNLATNRQVGGRGEYFTEVDSWFYQE